MEYALLALKAAGFGLAVAAPVGPMSLLCMRRTLALGWRQGLATGCGIAVGDALYGGVAALGLSGLSAFMLAHQRPLHLAAGIVLAWIGLRTLRARSAAASTEGQAGAPAAVFGGAVLLTLTNPPTIIMFAAIFAALAPASGFAPAPAACTVGGVFAGSLLWWCVVVTLIHVLRRGLGERARRWIDRASGLALCVFGAAEMRRAL